MPTPCLMPIAVVETHNDDTITFTRLPVSHDRVQPGARAVIWNTINNTALSKATLEITEVGTSVGSALISKSESVGAWPDGVDPLGPLNPIYMLLEGSDYEPDASRIFWIETDKQLKLLESLAEEHYTRYGTPPASASIIPLNNPLQDLETIWY